MRDRVVLARPDAGGGQVVEITVRHGYRPAAIRARAGRPLRVVFRREDDDACTERIVFSTPHLDRRLGATGLTTIELPALPPGDVRFTCGMGRYHGHIELVDRDAAGILAPLRTWASKEAEPLRTALVLWVSTLPLVVLVGIQAIGAASALLAAGAALVAWIAGCLWLFRGSTHPS